jgi:hypothetical protein
MRVNRVRLMMGVMLLLSVIGGLLAGAIPTSTYAQDGDDGSTPEATPTPDTGVIYGYRQEILFPAGIRFSVGLNAGLDNIDSITLTLRQQGGYEQITSLDLEANVVQAAGVVSDFVMFWDFAENPGLVPFLPVSFAWQVKTKDGLVSNAEDEFMLTDERRGEWQTAGQPPLVLYWLNEHLSGDTIRNEVLAAYGLMRQRTDQVPLFWYVIYDPNTLLCSDVLDPDTQERRSVVISYEDESLYPCSKSAFEAFYAAAGYKFIQRPTFGYSELQDLLIDDMVSTTYQTLWQDKIVPAWFVQGLAALHRLYPEIAAVEITRDAARKEALFLLPALISPLPDDADYQQRTMWEAQSYLMVLFLAEQHGASAPFDLAMAVIDDPDGFNGALRHLTGGDDQSLWQAWDRWLFTEAAVRAAQWTPYTITTPTPTATPTDTAIPPTFTPSVTPTITITPTSTFLGAQAPTVVVQRVTPTRMLTATNTPLPPGSLPTARPRPDESGSGSSGNNTARTGGLILIGAAVVVLVIGLFGLARRRR